jgi:glycosyltransferase involved in cell wall biosynthesis
MHPLVSVIVPVFNVDQYIQSCLNSILAQTYLNLEIILVNDGSTDKSGEICDKYAKNDKRIKLEHKENEGVSVARNTGIELSTGEWIMFVDADDWIEKDMVEKLLESVKFYNADLCYCNYSIDKKGHSVLRNFGYDIQDKHTDVVKSYCQAFTSVCAKLYNRSLILKNNLRFIKGLIIGEDVVFNLRTVSFNPIICYCDGYFYHYRMSSASAVHAYNSKAMNSLDMLVREIESCFPENMCNMAVFKKHWISYVIVGAIFTLCTIYVSSNFSISEFYSKRLEINNLFMKKQCKWAIRNVSIRYMETVYQAIGCCLLKFKQITLFYFFCKLRSLRRKFQAE